MFSLGSWVHWKGKEKNHQDWRYINYFSELKSKKNYEKAKKNSRTVEKLPKSNIV